MTEASMRKIRAFFEEVIIKVFRNFLEIVTIQEFGALHWPRAVWFSNMHMVSATHLNRYWKSKG